MYAPLIHEYQCSPGGKSYRDNEQPAPGIPGARIDEYIQRGYNNQQTVGGMNLHIKEIQGGEGQGHKGE